MGGSGDKMRLDVPVREGRLTVLLEPPKSKDSGIGMDTSGEHTWDVETSNTSRGK